MPQPTRLHPSLVVRVVPRELHWEVRAPGRPLLMIDTLCTKERAIEHALTVAEELMQIEGLRQVAVVIERCDGSVEMQHVA